MRPEDEVAGDASPDGARAALRAHFTNRRLALIAFAAVLLVVTFVMRERARTELERVRTPLEAARILLAHEREDGMRYRDWMDARYTRQCGPYRDRYPFMMVYGVRGPAEKPDRFDIFSQQKPNPGVPLLATCPYKVSLGGVWHDGAIEPVPLDPARVRYGPDGRLLRPQPRLSERTWLDDFLDGYSP